MPNKNSSFIIYLLCSPGFVLIDIWLPVIREIKKNKNIKIYFVFPEQSSLSLVNERSQLFRMSRLYIDGVIFKNYSNRWLASKSIDDAKDVSTINKIDKKILRLASRLISGKLSKIIGISIIGKIIQSLVVNKERIKLIIRDDKSFFIDKLDFFGNVSAILCDITTETKLCNIDFVEYFKKTPKFSMYHGPCARWLLVENRYYNVDKKLQPRDDVVVFAHSRYEVEIYKGRHNIVNKNIIVSGIARHDAEWINYVLDNDNDNDNDNDELVFNDFVFLIARPACSYLSVKKKKKILNDMNNLICNELNKKIVIKPHPKEDLSGLDGDIYMDVFGRENYGITWCYSELHSFVLCNRCEFAITFFSCVIADVISLGKPVVEYLDLRGIDEFDNEKSYRDVDGHPVFQERGANLVLGASDYQQFRAHIYNIINNRNKVFNLLKEKYDYYYPTYKNISKTISKNIFNYISE